MLPQRPAAALDYVLGDATLRPPGARTVILAHVCNDIGYWGAGFTGVLSRRYPGCDQPYRAWARGHDTTPGPFGLGEVMIHPVAPGVFLANMVGQRGIRRSEGIPPPVRYAAIEQCLIKLARHARDMGAAVRMPRIGCGLAGGSWQRIEPLILRTLVAAGVGVTVCDPPPRTNRT